MLHRSTYNCTDARYRNPIEAVKRFKKSAPVITYLKLDAIPEQLDAVASNSFVHVAVAIMIYAGLRPAEVFWLTDDDIDLDRRLIRVRAKSIGDRSWQTKTCVDRVIPISADLLNILVDYVATRGSRRRRGWSPVRCTVSGTRIISAPL